MRKPTVKELVETADISKGYASDILSGKQAPSQPLAIHIFHALGWRHPSIDGLSTATLAELGKVSPWVPTADRPKQGAAA